MADNDKKGFNASQFSGLPLKALIGAPLKAAADANGMMARSQTQFLLSTCFFKDPSREDVLKPVMVKFTLERQVLGDDGVEKPPVYMDFSVPLMTLIPINSLSVERLDVSFEIEVKSSTQQNAETTDDTKKSIDKNITSEYRGQQFTSEIHGTIASKSERQSSSSAKYEVKLEAGTLPLPKGITTIIDVFTKGITPVTIKKES